MGLPALVHVNLSALESLAELLLQCGGLFRRAPQKALVAMDSATAQVQPAEPMRYLPVPHTEQTARRAGRPFFIVTCSTFCEPVLVRHFKQ